MSSPKFIREIDLDHRGGRVAALAATDAIIFVSLTFDFAVGPFQIRQHSTRTGEMIPRTLQFGATSMSAAYDTDGSLFVADHAAVVKVTANRRQTLTHTDKYAPVSVSPQGDRMYIATHKIPDVPMSGIRVSAVAGTEQAEYDVPNIIDGLAAGRDQVAVLTLDLDLRRSVHVLDPVSGILSPICVSSDDEDENAPRGVAMTYSGVIPIVVVCTSVQVLLFDITGHLLASAALPEPLRGAPAMTACHRYIYIAPPREAAVVWVFQF